MRSSVLLVVIASIVSVSVCELYHRSFPHQKVVFTHVKDANSSRNKSVRWNAYEQLSAPDAFVNAAEVSSQAVVHIETQARSSGGSYDGFGYGDPYRSNKEPRGSGVVISQDGYIVTNSHVVQGEGDIEVKLHDGRSYVVKRDNVKLDTDTDLALLKINAKELPTLKIGDSNDVKVGEWVLAVGNPFNLSSTVTAGIVSAKGRDLGMLQGEHPIESFIQTDAAVNPGNSGGALVNTNGELIGINTAIATRSGTFSGYSFAIPINIASKVINDLKEKGVVDRGFIGANISDVDARIKMEMGLPDMTGVHIDYTFPNGASDKAGLKKGDVIIELHGLEVNSIPQLDERLFEFSPGDKINVTYIRGGKQFHTEMTVLNSSGDSGPTMSMEQELLEKLGAEFEELTYSELDQLGLRNGVRVKSVRKGSPMSRTSSIRAGYIIKKANNRAIKKVRDFYDELLNTSSGEGIMLEGVYPDQRTPIFHAFSLPKAED